jgi:HK97 family phage major capsid protein
MSATAAAEPATATSRSAKPESALKRIKVPERLFRTAVIEKDSINAEKKILRMSISSDVPYLRYDWWNDEEYYELLSHNTGDVDESRLKSGLPILFNHDRDAHLGRAAEYRNDGHKISVEAKFSESEFAQEKLRDAVSGVLPDTSVGYSIDDDGECIGAKDGIPIYKFKWTPYEASLVTVPADTSVGVGRNRDHKPKGEPVEIAIKNFKIEKKTVDAIETGATTTTSSNERKRKHNMSEQVAEVETISGKDLQKAQDDATAAERKRVKDIQELSEHFKKKGLAGRKIDTAAVAQQHIAEGKTVQDFKDACMTGTFAEIETVVTDEDGADNPSRVQVIGDRNGRNGATQFLSVGAEFVRDKGFKDAISRRGQGERVFSKDFDIAMLGVRGKAQIARKAGMSQRTGFTSGDLAPVNIQLLPGIVQLGLQRLTVMDLLTGGATDAAALIYPRENSYGSVDGTAVTGIGVMPRGKSVGERGLKPNWDPDLTTAVANVKKIAITTKVPDEFMADFPAAQSYIDGRLPFMVDTETEFQLLYGSGVGNDLLGIFTTAGIQSRVIDTTSDTTVAGSFKKGITDIRVGSFFEPDGFVFHPYDWETASLLKDLNNRFLAGGPFYIPYTEGLVVELYTLWGKPVVVTTACTYGKPLAGCWKLGAQYFMREGMRLQMTNANEDDFRRNLIAIRAEHRLALATYRPVAFLEFNSMPART